MLCIVNATILTPDRAIPDGYVIIRDGLIEEVGGSTDFLLPQNAGIIDGTGKLLMPGFIDLQINGAFGLDFTETPTSIWKVAARLPRFGVTSFLPTIITSPPAQIHEAQLEWDKGPPVGFSGSTPLGLHVEGPYLNPEKKGAHNPSFLRSPTQRPGRVIANLRVVTAQYRAVYQCTVLGSCARLARGPWRTGRHTDGAWR